jgi:peptidoglycan/xylan/chitin deacetylase (PgdA/CDA1 family)
MELGAHTVTHVILTREKRRTRRNEILESIARVRSITGQYDVPFSYPNGEPGDYDAFDMDLLAAIRVPYAVTEQPGWNRADTPVLELRRQCIGLHHHEQAFLAELYGLHDSHEEVHAQPAEMVASA